VRLVTTRAELETALAPARRSEQRVAFVPTMGALHEGHLSLFDLARTLGDVVVTSIFVNPLQFAPGEDLARYPRSLERDTGLADARGVDVVFAPTVAELYVDAPARVVVTAPALTDRLCGAFRPGHFDGVLTVVAKLFNLVRPHSAVFGQKDLQQAALIRRMVQDLDFAIAIHVGPIVREADGLALSSRNAYLAADERRAARALSRALRAGAAAWRAGERSRAALLERAHRELAAESGVRVEYLELVDATSLEPLDRAVPGAALAVAAYVGTTRLIDNLLLGGAEP
jgi:pantoate--beta-alanine ligase